MKIVTTVVFLMMLGLAWGQTPSFYYEVEYEYTGIDPLDGDSLFNVSCVVDVDESVSQIELKVGTLEEGSDLLDALFELSTYVDVSLNQESTEATINLGEFPQFDKFFMVRLFYSDGSTSEAVSKSILFNIPPN